MKTRLFSAAFLLVLCQFAYTQQTFNNVAGRQTISLNGNWQYIVDPYETGYANFHGEIYDQKNLQSTSAYYNNYHAKNKQELVEFDFDKSPVMKIPGDWNTQRPELYYYEGTIWFKKSFDYTPAANRKQFLYFGAVNYRADVYLNGTKLGFHEGGFTPFQFEVTGLIKPSGNFLVVKVDDKRRKDGVPALNTDWWNYGGITRGVILIDEPAVFVKDYTIQLEKGPSQMIKGEVKLSEAKAHTEVAISIPQLKWDVTALTDEHGIARFYFSATAYASAFKKWSPESPYLYDVTIKTPWQNLREKIGFRIIETRGPDILLNGKSVYLRGISIHEDFQGHRPDSKAVAVTMLQQAKELGCNYVRLAHYPHNEYMLRMADSMGLLVWEELPVYWAIDFNNPAVFGNVMNQMQSMISRDKNRACTIIWSVANETPQASGRNQLLSHMASEVRQLDSTRLVSAALLTRNDKGVNIVDDSIGAVFDIISFNQYRGWYGGDLDSAPDAKWEVAFNKPVIISEFGGDAKQGLHGKKDERWTEEYQEYLYQQNLKMLDKISNVRGMSPWILYDFRSPRRKLPGIQDEFNRKGLVSDKGIKKKAFFVLQEFYRSKSLLY